MRRRRSPKATGSWKRSVVRSSMPEDTFALAQSFGPQFSDPVFLGKYRKLMVRHLGKQLDKLFADFTGLHFHIAWAPAKGHGWDARSLPTACSVCCQLSGSPLQPGCQVCGPRQLMRALNSDGDGNRFTCGLGVRNFWVPIRVRGETLGLAYLQALDHLPPASARPRGRGNVVAVVINPIQFAQAARLLRFVIQHVQTASLSDLHALELTNAGRAVVALERQQARLHEALKQHLPAAPNGLRQQGSESKPEQLVHRLLECISSNYSRPITLGGCAAKLGMNAAYLSDLFSHTVGVPFKAYLTDLRMAKARELLGEPRMNLSEVAAAVGYSSESRFRLAFKKATGLTPKLWRETMESSPSERSSA
jgi:AraC-like DNA-binding protein